jgi:stage II sporulation protein D
MSIKKKLILIGICICVIIGVFTINVFRNMQFDYWGGDTEKDGFISQGEACRLLSYLNYDKTKRESLPIEITYANRYMSGWYDPYVNAVWKMGLIEENIKKSPRKAMTYGSCKKMIDQFILKYPKLQDVYSHLSFDFVKADEKMRTLDFLEMYEAMLAVWPKQSKPVQKKTLYILGKDSSDQDVKRMITDQGRFDYQDSKDYQRLSNPDQKKDIADRYLNKGVCAYVCGQELVYVSSEAVDEVVLHNVWIKQGEYKQMDVYICGFDKHFLTEYPLKERLEKVVGNITVKNQRVTKVSVKPDMISGRVLQSGKDYIEIENYGKVPLEEGYKIYKVYGEISMETTNSILVGYDTTDFVVSNGKISAALIRKKIKADTIRVLLKTSDYKEIYHDRVYFTADRDFTVRCGKDTKTYRAGQKLIVKKGNQLFKKGRIRIQTAFDQGKIQILSIKRSYGNPKYRGKIEISESKEGLFIINELSMEEYLYAVIPSEMPTQYGLEALKVQAVCARSYAYNNLVANSLSQYGAHVDDSVSYQVYNNTPENESSILAVKDTYGQVIKYGNDVITAFYFSTSCGHTTKPACVWSNAKSLPYLEGKLLMDITNNTKNVRAQEKEIRKYKNLSKEKTFRDFIKRKDIVAYDSQFSWFRWHATINIADVKRVIDSNLLTRYNVNPQLILTRTGAKKGRRKEVFESSPVNTVGTIVDISVLKRGTGGIITELLITGTKNTIKVKTEYNIRALLAPLYSTVVRQDLSKVKHLALLPSAFFVIDRNEEKGRLESITLSGGGYGHGVGMSQNGVKGMTDAGKKYDEIIPYFYEGTKLGHCYE